MASSDYCSRFRYWQFSQVPLQDFQSTRTRLRALRVRLAPKVPFELRSSVHSHEVSRVPLLNFPDTRSSYVPPRFNYLSRFDSLLLASW